MLEPSSGPLHLREDSVNGVIVSGLRLVQIENAEHLFELLRQGNSNRTQHPTDANAESSRSHAVFQVRTGVFYVLWIFPFSAYFYIGQYNRESTVLALCFLFFGVEARKFSLQFTRNSQFALTI